MDNFAEWVRLTFGLGEGRLARSVGGHGADGDVWHLQVGDRKFAIKRHHRAFDVEAVRREATLLDELSASGVEVPTHVTTPDGALVADVPTHLGGGSARVSHWIAGVPATEHTAGVAEELGTLLAQLHRAGPASREAPGPWYTSMVAPHEWVDLAGQSVGRPWHTAFVARLGDLTAYADLVDRAGPGTGPFVLGHRDLHPDNALVAPDGSLRALDWEDSGPVDPTRELAKTLVQWHVLGEEVDEQAIARTVAAYGSSVGPGLLTGREDFAMVLCSESSFLAHQLRLALDDDLPAQRREQVQDEIHQALSDYLPSLSALDRVLAAARSQ